MESLANLTDTSFTMSCMRCNRTMHDADRFCGFCGQDQLDAQFDPWASRPAALEATYRPTALAPSERSSAASFASLISADARSSNDAAAEYPSDAAGSASTPAPWETLSTGRSTFTATRLSIGLMAIATLGLLAALTHDLYRTLQDEKAQGARPDLMVQRVDNPGVQLVRQVDERPTQAPPRDAAGTLPVDEAPMFVAASTPADVPAPAPAPMPAASGPSPSALSSSLADSIGSARDAPDTSVSALGATRPASCHEALAAMALCTND